MVHNYLPPARDPSRTCLIWQHGVLPVLSVLDLGLYLDFDVAAKTVIYLTVYSCFIALLTVRCSLPHETVLLLMQARVVIKANYKSFCYL